MDRGRWEPREVEDAAKRLGFGLHNDIKVNLEEFEDGFVYNAYEHAMTRSWKEDASIATRKDLTRALHIIAEHRGSKDLKAKAEEGDGSAEMIPEKAYLTLEVPENVDEEMLITVYKMRVRIISFHHQHIKNNPLWLGGRFALWSEAYEGCVGCHC